MSYKQELQKMFDLQKFGMKFGLDNMLNLLDRLKKPHEHGRFIHLAGTNGKGSAGAMLQSILSTTGYRVGLYTSPHLITFRERIKINDDLISEDEVLALSAEIWAVCNPDSPPTFFEFVTAMAFLHFQRQKVDLAIIETGLGGRLDSTNVITPLASAITNISIEHAEQLGDTLAKIAFEKAGIIKPKRPVITGPLFNEAREVVIETAAKQNSLLLMAGRDFQSEVVSFDDFGRPTFNYQLGELKISGIKCGLSGPHQAQNAAVAISFLPFLADRGFPATESDLRAGLAKVSWPGRAEFFTPSDWPPNSPKAKAPLMLDGAHNPAGAQALAQALKSLKPRKLHFILGVMADKDIAGVLAPLYEMADRFYLTRPAFSRAAEPALLQQKMLDAFGPFKVPHSLHPTLPEAIGAAAKEAQDGDLAVLSGSLFMVGEGRAYLLGIDEVESN